MQSVVAVSAFTHEVIDWNGYSQAQKQAIDARLDRFLAMCVGNKLRIVDQKLLDWQLSVQKIRHQPHHDPYCHLFALLKAGCESNWRSRAIWLRNSTKLSGAHTGGPARSDRRRIFGCSPLAHFDRYIATG